MNPMRTQMESRLKEIEGVDIVTWKDTGFVSVTYNGKEIAHFHGDTTLDLRLSQKIIRAEGLSRDASQEYHPERSLNSLWICVSFNSEAEIEDLMGLVKQACDLRK